MDVKRRIKNALNEIEDAVKALKERVTLPTKTVQTLIEHYENLTMQIAIYDERFVNFPRIEYKE